MVANTFLSPSIISNLTLLFHQSPQPLPISQTSPNSTSLSVSSSYSSYFIATTSRRFSLHRRRWFFRFEAEEFDMADLLFLDNPVGTGYSFVEDTKLLVKTDEEAATDLTTLFNTNASLQKSPLYIVAESYGGKYDVTLALSALKAIDSEKLKLKFGGCCLSPYNHYNKRTFVSCLCRFSGVIV